MESMKVKMFYSLYAIYDNERKEYNKPFICLDEIQAKRLFIDFIRQSKLIPVKNIELWYIGYMNAETADIETNIKQCIITGTDAKTLIEKESDHE